MRISTTGVRRARDVRNSTTGARCARDVRETCAKRARDVHKRAGGAFFLLCEKHDLLICFCWSCWRKIRLLEPIRAQYVVLMFRSTNHWSVLLYLDPVSPFWADPDFFWAEIHLKLAKTETDLKLTSPAEILLLISWGCFWGHLEVINVFFHRTF
jgi:hypothetical protein